MFDELVFNRISMQLTELNANIKSLQNTIERTNRGTLVTTKNPYMPTINISDYDVGLPVMPTVTGVAAEKEPEYRVMPMMEPTEPVYKRGGVWDNAWPFPIGTTTYIDKSGK